MLANGLAYVRSARTVTKAAGLVAWLDSSCTVYNFVFLSSNEMRSSLYDPGPHWLSFRIVVSAHGIIVDTDGGLEMSSRFTLRK